MASALGEEIGWRGFWCLNFIKNTGLQNIFNFRFYLALANLLLLIIAVVRFMVCYDLLYGISHWD
jgi:hypothetical protein